ncbi:MAG: hypothetical protein Q9191_006624, partial [Dirinaria sp. TL-2023a]
MASTINGYEGTGRSLSLKLISQLREQSRGIAKANSDDAKVADRSGDSSVRDREPPSSRGRSLREITLSEPIRYAQGDSVEKWLNKVLCLDATLPTSKLTTLGCPHPSKCELLHVNRDTLFSFHPVSEKFLQQMIALYVASHYKNSPNDLQLMSDAPAHQLFVLVPPIDDSSPRLPEPLCVIQVALEGQISRQSVLNSLSRGQRAGGDLIPWLVSQQFQDEDFASLSGVRIVRIATNPEYVSMGYGSRALSLLTDFYEGKFANLSETEASDGPEETMVRVTDAELESSTLLSDNVKVRDINAMPPLFSKLSERRPQALDYLGVSYGLTQALHKFWKRASFAPVYLRQTPNELTGEHSCVMLRTLSSPNNNSNSNSNPNTWLSAFALDFQHRFHSLLSFQFRTFPSILALSINESASRHTSSSSSPPPFSKTDLDTKFNPFDLKRLNSYAQNMLDYHVILDLIPAIAQLFFSNRLPEIALTGVQRAILLSIGLQHKPLSDLEPELGLPASQLLAMFVKLIRKMSRHFEALVEAQVRGTIIAAPPPNSNHSNNEDPNEEEKQKKGPLSSASAPAFAPLPQDLNTELREGAQTIERELKEKQKALIDALPLDRFEIEDDDDDGRAAEWEQAEKVVRRKAGG